MSAGGLLLAATPRSGSTLLCDLLRQTGVCGWPESWFHAASMPEFAARWGVPSCDLETFGTDYLAAARKAGEFGTGRFAMRLMGRELWPVEARLAALFPKATPGLGRFEAAFGPLKVVHLTRADKAAQAVSRLRAERSGLWHLNADGSERERLPSSGPLVYDRAALAVAEARVVAQDAAWRDWFGAQLVIPLQVVYEDLVADPACEVARILGHLDADRSRAAQVVPGTRPVADALSREWLAQYRDETEKTNA